MTKSARWLSMAWAMGLVGLSCSATNSLSGSLSELFSLDVSTVQVARDTEAVQINYYYNRDQSIDLVVGVTVATGDQNFRDGAQIPLQGEYPVGHQRTTVVHLASGEPERVLPPVTRGDLQISKNGAPGEQMKGSFNISFGTGGDIGDGRNLDGNFYAVVKDGGF